MEFRTLEAVVQMVMGIRAQCDAILTLLTEPAPSQPASEPACEHPMQAREDLRTAGSSGPHWRCTLCDYEYSGGH